MARHATAPVEGLLIGRGFDGEAAADEPMALHTTYRIGGPARWFVRADSLGALMQIVRACRDEGVPCEIVGRGSNLLVADAGFDGAIVTLGRDFRTFRVDEGRGIIASGAGVLLSAVVQEAFRKSLGGLEFAVGTPGSIGGALRMNAGSADEWIGGAVQSVTTFSLAGGMVRRRGDEIEWGYRTTSFAPDEIILECELALEAADPFFIRGRMEANLKRRKETQPLSVPSCGSVFRNPTDGPPVAKMIDDLGLKGTRAGGAQISEKHANFIVNTGGAAASDVCGLISLIRRRVREAYGIELATEVRFIGF